MIATLAIRPLDGAPEWWELAADIRTDDYVGSEWYGVVKGYRYSTVRCRIPVCAGTAHNPDAALRDVIEHDEEARDYFVDLLANHGEPERYTDTDFLLLTWKLR